MSLKSADMPQMESVPAVEFRHITKRFPNITANDDISFSVQQGEIFALLGENGAGKSTLMSCLFGLYEPDEGEILIRGKTVHIHTPAQAAALNIGMVHQHFKLVNNQSVTENIILGREPVQWGRGLFCPVDMKGAVRQVGELSQAYSLEIDPNAIIGDLSVSARQRVEILKMLYRNADILIFDEPTAVLTPQEIDALLKIITALRDSGKTVILITHKLEEIKHTADRCGILCHGQLTGVYRVQDIDIQKMALLMVGSHVKLQTEKKLQRLGKPYLQSIIFPILMLIKLNVYAMSPFLSIREK